MTNSFSRKILVLGSGGREHAMAKRLSEDNGVEKVFVMPGNPGMEQTPSIECVAGNIKDREALSVFIEGNQIDLVVVGPEDPLADGIVDYFNDKDVAILGPSKLAAQLESSKAFSKDFMREFEIPTAEYKSFTDYEKAKQDLESNPLWDNGVVVKASSLAAGKGVFVCDNRTDALSALYNIMVDTDFTVNSDTVVLEQVLKGKELSAFALCDGQGFINLGVACDHKRLMDDDKGPNTGGMGTYIPQAWPSQSVLEKINQEVVEKVVKGMKQRGIPFRGILFVGLMIDNEDINVIEFNVRFGDPETQVIMPTLEGNLTENFIAAAKHDLALAKEYPLKNNGNTAVHVVKVSKGYPALDGKPMLRNQVIHKDACLDDMQDIHLYYAGVGFQGSDLVNTGGRVLGVTAVGSDFSEVRKKAYKSLDYITFEGAFWRRDIGLK